jgi:hypothetical protein
MKSTLLMPAAILAAWAFVGYVDGAQAEGSGMMQSFTNPGGNPSAVAAPRANRTVALPAPAIPGLPKATLQYRQELARVTALLAANPNAFGGYNTSNTLAELRAQVDANIKARFARELQTATSRTQLAQIRATQAAFWTGLDQRREVRTKFTDEQNIVHSLMMILQTKAKLN